MVYFSSTHSSYLIPPTKSHLPIMTSNYESIHGLIHWWRQAPSWSNAWIYQLRAKSLTHEPFEGHFTSKPWQRSLTPRFPFSSS
jgi:hypothetical protein